MTGPMFYVERYRALNWQVRVRHDGGSYWVASFWRESSATSVADRLSSIALIYGWQMEPVPFPAAKSADDVKNLNGAARSFIINRPRDVSSGG